MSKVTITLTDMDGQVDVKFDLDPPAIEGSPLTGATLLGFGLMDTIPHIISQLEAAMAEQEKKVIVP